jgi:hypothetical protein
MAKLPSKFVGVQLFPTINLIIGGDKIKVNFGNEDFLFTNFDIVLY